MEKCMPIKKELVKYMAKYFPDFSYEGGNSQFYAFRRENTDGIYDHIIIQREFFEGTISLVITEVASCYNKSWKGIPMFTVGYETDIGVLITGKHCYNADIGWHRCKNNSDELSRLLGGIRKDIETYVLSFFAMCHEKINKDKSLAITNLYMQSQFEVLNEGDINLIKAYLVDVNKAYSKYIKDCRKSGAKVTSQYFDIIPLHFMVEQWLMDIQQQLDYTCRSEEKRMQIIKNMTVLFRDNYNFYNL